MEIILVVILVVYFIVSGIGIFIGLDLKKKSSWIYGMYGFFSGLLIGLLIADVNTSLLLGFLFAFAVMYGGAMTYIHRQRFK